MADLLGKDHPFIPCATEGVKPGLVMDVYGVLCGPDITLRCGVPFEGAFRKGQKALFLVCIDQCPQQGQQECIGSFKVKQDIFHRFFGLPEGSYELYSQSWQRSPEPLQHLSTQVDDKTPRCIFCRSSNGYLLSRSSSPHTGSAALPS